MRTESRAQVSAVKAGMNDAVRACLRYGADRERHRGAYPGTYFTAAAARLSGNRPAPMSRCCATAPRRDSAGHVMQCSPGGAAMKRKRFWEIGGFLAGAVLILFGIVAIFMGATGYNTTRDAIKGEGITFGTADDPAVAKYASQWAGTRRWAATSRPRSPTIPQARMTRTQPPRMRPDSQQQTAPGTSG